MTYTGIAQHKVVVGVDAQWNTRVEQQYYEVDSGDMILDTNDTSRTVGLYAQDEWRFHPQWLLNASLRYDKHSDFDAVTSPRSDDLATDAAAVVERNRRQFLSDAERLRAFLQRCGRFANANPDLKRRKYPASELAAAYRFGQGRRVGLSVYRSLDHRPDRPGDR